MSWNKNTKFSLQLLFCVQSLFKKACVFSTRGHTSSHIYLLSHRKKLKIVMPTVKRDKKNVIYSNSPEMQLLKASKWSSYRNALVFSVTLLWKPHESSYKNSHRWNHSCDAFLNQNPNKQTTTLADPGGRVEWVATASLGSFFVFVSFLSGYPCLSLFHTKNNIISYNLSSSPIGHYKKTVAIPLLELTP